MSVAAFPAVESSKSNANTNGESFERSILSTLEQNFHDFGLTRRVLMARNGEATRAYENWRTPQSIIRLPDYGLLYKPRRTQDGLFGNRELDFFIWTPAGTMEVEAKFQDSSGSVNHKLPYCVMEMLVHSDARYKFVVIDGEKMQDYYSLQYKVVNAWGDVLNPVVRQRLMNDEIRFVSPSQVAKFHCALLRHSTLQFN